MTLVSDEFDDKCYYMLLAENGLYPTRKHLTLESAEEEAQRLISKAEAEEVIILKAIKVAKRPEPKVDFINLE